MKRDPALASLSRDHHETLVIAQALRRATTETAEAACMAFLSHWDTHGRGHFRLEEDVLLPAYAVHGDAFHPLVARTLCEHVDIRRRAAALAESDSAVSVTALNELGAALADHVRGEERELFVLIEQAMPAESLAALDAALARAERGGDRA